MEVGRCVCGVMESWGFGRGQRRVGGLGQAGCRWRCRCGCFKQRATVNTASINCRQATVLCTSRRPWNRARNREQWSKSRITTGDGVSYPLWPARICGEGCASWAIATKTALAPLAIIKGSRARCRLHPVASRLPALLPCWGSYFRLG
jgi:hypothetical protein